MQITDIRKLTDAEINEKIDDAKEELFNLRFQKAQAQLENTARLVVVRRTVARLKTVLHERKLAAQIMQEQGNAK